MLRSLVVGHLSALLKMCVVERQKGDGRLFAARPSNPDSFLYPTGSSDRVEPDLRQAKAAVGILPEPVDELITEEGKATADYVCR